MVSTAELYTDGSCQGNPGPGGWGVLLRIGGKEKELFGGEADTTNNRMELTAVIKGLEFLSEPCRVRVTTDSKYVKDGITKWVATWKKKGWRTANNDPVKNRDLWERLHELVEYQQQTEWVWVRGHNGHPENERADQLANQGLAGLAHMGKITTLRQIALDTETTGLNVESGHRIIEIAGVELINRRLTHKNFHYYLHTDREMDASVIAIHGITNEFLASQPCFADIAAELIAYLKGSELIIHNASFDVGFLNAEFARLAAATGKAATCIEDVCSIIDTLAIARKSHPGQRNNLDGLCKRYGIDASNRKLHGALLDAGLLAEVYLAMTGGQTSLSLDTKLNSNPNTTLLPTARRHIAKNRPQLKVIHPSPEEESLHRTRLEQIDGSSGGRCIWKQQP